MPITIRNVTHVFNPRTLLEKVALDQISLEINDGEMIALIGHTGSGKSTLIQHLNGLLTPTNGKVYVDGMDIADKKTKTVEIRKRVGLVFQYPEYQLFKDTVEEDIAFGLKNLRIPEKEISGMVKTSMEQVGLDYQEYRGRSPFELSGGEKRRAAIAGILVMRPKMLIFDEPTAGLDPKGRDELLAQIRGLHRQEGITVLIVSHSMEEVAEFADRIIVMNQGKIVLDGPPDHVFRQVSLLEEIGLCVPQVTYLALKLRQQNFDIKENIYTLEHAKEAILQIFEKEPR
jgi:energy-coupling factor transport system ATP-binding protein